MGQFEEYLKDKKVKEIIVQNGRQFTEEEFEKQGDKNASFQKVTGKELALSQYKERGLGPNAEAEEETASYIQDNLRMRLEQTTFQERTDYYFKDSEYLDAKAKRYRALAEDKGNAVGAHARKYGNHSAKKRKKAARKSAEYFEKARRLEEKQAQDRKKAGRKPLTPLEEYKNRDAIMRLRMEGMIEAAKVKSTSDKNENYRIAKAKLSCLTILLDQAQNLRQETSRDFDKIEKGLRSEMKAAEKELNKYGQNADEKWKQELGCYDKEVLKKEKFRDDLTDEDVRLMLQMSTPFKFLAEPEFLDLIKQANDNKAIDKTLTFRGDELIAACYVVRKDRNGKPLNKEEQRKEEWNKKWMKAFIDKKKDPDAQKMLLEAYKRMEQIQLPTPKELKKKGPDCFKGRMHLLLEMRQISILLDNIGKDDRFSCAYNFVRTDRALEKRLTAMTFMCSYLNTYLKENHLIDQYNRYTLVKDPNKRKLNEQESIEVASYESTTETFLNSYEYTYKEMLEEEKERDKYLEEAKPKQIEDYQTLKNTKAGNNPAFTEEAYDRFKQIKAMDQTLSNPYYLQAFEPIHKKKGSTNDLSRMCGTMLRLVHFDKNWNPVSDEDLKAHLWNLKFLDHLKLSIIGKELEYSDMTDDVEQMERSRKRNSPKSEAIVNEMIMEQLSREFCEENFPLPAPEVLNKEILEPLQNGQKEINSAYMDSLWENYEKYLSLCQKSLTLENLKKENAFTKEYLEDHPELEAYSDAFSAMSEIMKHCYIGKYGFNPGLGKNAEPMPEKAFSSMAVMGMIGQYKIDYEDYKAKKNKA